MKAQRGSAGTALPYFLTSVQMGVGGQHHALATWLPERRAGTQCTRGCVGPRVVLDVCGKFCPPPPKEFDSWTTQPVMCHNTCYAISAWYCLLFTVMTWWHIAGHQMVHVSWQTVMTICYGFLICHQICIARSPGRKAGCYLSYSLPCVW